jgi:DNA (cytosine-5)-methyltransferase 1
VKVVDLFSGIGGFSLGLESTGGFETIQFVENESWCQKILAKNFPEVPIAGDIREYEGQRADVVVGGFPCQPFSVAGKRKGTRDDRHLWPEMLRVIKACKPRWVIGENVRNLTSIQDGMVFEQVCTDLENENYEVQPFVIPASAVNAPHQRYRVWIVAYSKLNGLTSTKKRRSIEETVREESQGQNRTLDSQRASNLSETKGNVANANDTGDRTSEYETQRQGQKIDQRREELTQFESSRLCADVANSKISERDALQTNREHGETTPQEVFRDRSGIQRQTSWWSSEPRVGRVAYGVSDKVDRLKGLGNAIVPQIAYQIGLAIIQTEDEQT